MQAKYRRKNRMIAASFTTLLAVFVMLQSTDGRAQELSASAVLKKMDPEQTSVYLTGIIEGLAYARYEKEGKQRDGGMKCIYGWFYNGGQSAAQILQAFQKFKNHSANAIVAAMVAQKCGK